MSSIPIHPSLQAPHAPVMSARDITAPMATQSEPVSLLARLRSRDEAALVQITRQYGAAMTRAAFLHTGDAAAAEDATQEALIGAWEGGHRTNEATPLWPWLLGITLNHCRKHLRSLSRRRRREQHAHALRQAHQASIERNADSDRAEALRIALLTLPELFRCVIILRYEQGLSIVQTAEALNLPQGTVKRRCHDAISRLKLHMRDAT